MSIDKLIPRYLNTDDDDRLIKNVEMTDALNVRIASDTTGDAMVIKNSYGNAAVPFSTGNNWQGKTHALPAGTNTVIGSVADTQTGDIIFFVWNSANDHSVYRFSTAIDACELIYRDAILGFINTTYVQGEIIKNLVGDTLLYFTDGSTPPKKINVSRMILGGYSSVLNTGTNFEKLQFFTLAKMPPLSPPTYAFFTDTSLGSNQLYESNFQFAYQYIYFDGEVSAISQYSGLAISKYQYLDGIASDEQKLENNVVRVYVNSSVGDVKRIRILGRNGNQGAFFIVEEIANPASSTQQTFSVDFKNDSLYRYISLDEQNKLYDNVPITAQAVTISNGRVFLGNYSEGYANARIDTQVIPNYEPAPAIQNIDVRRATNPMDVVKIIHFDLSALDSAYTDERVLNIDFTYDLGTPDRDTPANSGVVRFKAANYFFNWTELKDSTLESRNAGGLIKNYIQVYSSPISSSTTTTIPAGSTRSDIATIISNKVCKSYPVYFNSEEDEAYITQLKDSKIASATSVPRYALMYGEGTAKLYFYGFDTATNILSVLIRFEDCSFKIKGIYGGYLIDINEPNFNNEKVIGSSDAVLYTRDAGFYDNLAFTDTEKETLEDDTIVIVGNPEKTTTGRFSSNLKNSNTLYSSTFISDDLDGYKSFKSGSDHSLGVVFYDDRNRSGSVQKLQSCNVKWYTDREYKGKSSLVLRVKSNGPSWAKRWSPVYVKTGTVSDFLQYTVIQGFFMTNAIDVKSNNETSNEDLIYLSFRSLEGKNNSYKESRGANIEYKFQENDRLRVINYAGGTYVDADFEVVGYKYFENDIKENPLLDESNEDSIFNTTGWFLVLKDKDIPGFSKESIIDGTDNWDNKCIIELYRQRKTSDQEIYYEVGKSYAVANGMLSGDREFITPIASRCVTAGLSPRFYTVEIVYAGDILSDGTNSFVVTNVYQDINTVSLVTYNYVVDASMYNGSFTVNTNYTLNIQNSSDAVIQITEGDSYYRLRALRYGTAAKATGYMTRYVESNNINDFYPSISTSIGRPNIVNPDIARVFRTGSVTYSDPFVIDSSYIGLSSFNASLANFYDLNYIHGPIRSLINRDDSVVFLQDKKVGIFPVGRNIIEFSDGSENITASRDVIGVPRYYAGDYGVNNNPESIATEGGRIYFTDIKGGKVMRLSQDGLTPISEVKMDSYFKKRFRDIVEKASVKKVIGGVDEETGEYIVSSSSIVSSSVTIQNATPSTIATYTVQVNTGATKVLCQFAYNDSILFTASTEIRDFDDLCDTFDNSLNAVAFLDRMADGYPVYIGEEFIGQSPLSLYGVATNTNYDFFVPITINVSDGSFVFANNCGDFTGTINPSSESTESWTTAFDTDSSVWNTRYSFYPENVTSIDDTLYTFKNGVMYKHSSAVPRSTYYGAASAGSIVEVVSNYNPSMVKAYESISLEGSDEWSAVVTNTDQSTTISTTDYEQKERNYYAYIPRDSSANTGSPTITALSGSSEIFALGAVAVGGVSGATITFTSLVGAISFPISASLYKVSGSTLVSLSLTVTSITGEKQITCSGTVSGVIAGDEIVAIGNSLIEGDQMRDYFAKIRLYNENSNEVELYAVNAIYSKSNLHNELGQ